MTTRQDSASGFWKKVFRKNWLPLLFFSFFVLLNAFALDALGWLGSYGITEMEGRYSVVTGIGLWVTGAFFADRLIISILLDGIIAGAMQRVIPDILRTMIGVLILFAAVVGITSTVFDQSVSGLWATSGVAGIILGIALRPMILDVFAGLAVNLEMIFKIGDWVEIDGGNKSSTYKGWVHEISWRTTQLRNRSGDIVVFPNSFLASSVVINHSLPRDTCRQALKVLIEPDIPSERAIRILKSAITAVIDGDIGPIAEPPSRVVMSDYTNSGVEYTVLYWICPTKHAPYTVRDRLLSSIHSHMSQAGVIVSHPKTDIYLTRELDQSIDVKRTEDRIRFLRKIELFEALERQDISMLARQLKHRKYPKGQILVASGSPGASMFIIIEGLLEVLSKADEYGQSIKLGQLTPGHFFGEMSLLTGEPRSATIIASTDSVVFEVTKEDIKPLLKQKPELSKMLSRVIAQRQTGNVKKIREASIAEEEKEPDDISHIILGKIKRFFNMQ